MLKPSDVADIVAAHDSVERGFAAPRAVLTPDPSPDSAGLGAVLLGKLPAGDSPGKVFLDDVDDVLVREGGQVVSLARLGREAVASLLEHIRRVLLLGSEKEVTGVDALPVVAVVADTQPVRDGVVVQMEGTVGHAMSVLLAQHLAGAVAVAQALFPFPAAILSDFRSGLNVGLDCFFRSFHDNTSVVVNGVYHVKAV